MQRQRVAARMVRNWYVHNPHPQILAPGSFIVFLVLESYMLIVLGVGDRGSEQYWSIHLSVCVGD